MHLAFSLSPEKAKLWRELFGAQKGGPKAATARDSTSPQASRWYWVMKRPGLRPDLMEAANLDNKAYLCLEHSTLFTQIDFSCSTEFLMVVPHDRIAAQLAKHADLYANFELVTRPAVNLKIEFTKTEIQPDSRGGQGTPVVATCLEPVSYKKGPVEGFIQLTEMIEEMLKSSFLMGGPEEEPPERPVDPAAPARASEGERGRARGESSDTDISGLSEDGSPMESLPGRRQDIYLCPRNALIAKTFDSFSAMGPEYITLNLSRTVFTDGQVEKRLKALSTTAAIVLTYQPVAVERPSEEDPNRLDPASLRLLSSARQPRLAARERIARSTASVSAYIPSKTLAAVYRQAASVATALGLGWSLVMTVSERVVVFAVLTRGGEEFYQVCCEVIVQPGV